MLIINEQQLIAKLHTWILIHLLSFFCQEKQSASVSVFYYFFLSTWGHEVEQQQQAAHELKSLHPETLLRGEVKCRVSQYVVVIKMFAEWLQTAELTVCCIFKFIQAVQKVRASFCPSFLSGGVCLFIRLWLFWAFTIFWNVLQWNWFLSRNKIKYKSVQKILKLKLTCGLV